MADVKSVGTPVEELMALISLSLAPKTAGGPGRSKQLLCGPAMLQSRGTPLRVPPVAAHLLGRLLPPRLIGVFARPRPCRCA